MGMGDPPPSAGVPAGMSGWSRYGSIRMVGSLGQPRSATYRDIYLLNPFVFAAVNHIARGIGRLPLHVYELSVDTRGAVDKNRIRSDIPQTPGRPLAGVALDRILTSPSMGVSAPAFYGGTMRDKLLYGNALWE